MGIPFHFDGNWIDACSFVSGLIYIPIQRYRRQTKTKLFCKATGSDFANGAALFPLFVLTMSAFSTELLKGLLEASKLSLCVAGVFALLSIIEEP